MQPVHFYARVCVVNKFCQRVLLIPLILINSYLDIGLNKKRRDTKLIARRFEDNLSSLSSDRKNSVLKFKGANIQYCGKKNKSNMI